MNPPPNPPNPSPDKPAPLVIPDHSWRNTFLAVVAGLIVLGFVIYGTVQMSRPVQGNKLTGQIVEKVFTPQPERQVTFSGNRIEGTKEIAGDYLLKVTVGEEKRIYEVPVDQFTYDSKKVGDSLDFIRPVSEQR